MAFSVLTDVLPGLRRRPPAVASRPDVTGPQAASPRPYVAAGEPAHSPACYCAVTPWPPCWNCVAEGFADAAPQWPREDDQ